MTEPSKSLTPYYFDIEGLDSSIDAVGEALADLGYNGPTPFTSADTEACQLNKECEAILLHTLEIDESRYIAGLTTPVIPNVSELRRYRMIEAISFLVFIIYLGIVIGIALAGLGVRGEARPYLLEWLVQNWIMLSGIGIVLFFIPFGLCFRFLKLNLIERNYEAAEKAHADLTAVLNRFCSSLRTEIITVLRNPRNPEEKGVNALPEVVRESLEQLVLVIYGLNKIEGSILDINLKPIKPDVTRTY